MSVLQYSDSTFTYLTVRYCTVLQFSLLCSVVLCCTAVFQSGTKIKTHLLSHLSFSCWHIFNLQLYFTDKTVQVTVSTTVIVSQSLLVFLQNYVSSIHGNVCNGQNKVWHFHRTYSPFISPLSQCGQENYVTETTITWPKQVISANVFPRLFIFYWILTWASSFITEWTAQPQ